MKRILKKIQSNDFIEFLPNVGVTALLNSKEKMPYNLLIDIAINREEEKSFQLDGVSKEQS